MGVAPNDTILQKHYGSAFTMTDYVSNVHNVYVSASYLPVPELTLFGTVVYNQTEASLDPVEMPDVTPRLDGDLAHMDYNFEEMHMYSDLEYGLWRLTLGMEYRVSSMWRITIDGDYAKLEDNAGYVYGVESGSYFIGRAGARIVF